MSIKYPTTSKTMLEKISSGDEICWDDFYSRYSPVVIAIARFKGLDDTTAQDICQQVMVQFFQQSKTFRFDPQLGRFRTYFGRIIRAKIAEALKADGIDAAVNGCEVSAKGLKAYFNQGAASITVGDDSIKVEAAVMPNIAASACLAISLIFDLIGLFSSCELEAVLVMVLVIALGAAGTIGSLITFFMGKELLRQKLALLINTQVK